jgi:hypothetical protein
MHLMRVLLAGACALFFSSCPSLGLKPKLVGSVVVSSDAHSAAAVARFDGDTLLVVARAALVVELYEKPSATMAHGATLLGPFEVEAGYVLVWSRSREIKLTQKLEEPLPAWLVEQAVLRHGEAEALGLSFVP